MSLETSQKVLKISGILSIIGAVFTIIGGLLVTLGGGLATTDAAASAMAQAGLNKGDAAIVLVAGIVTIVSGIFYLIEGIVSVRASKDTKYGTGAWIFAIIGMVTTIIRAVSEFKSSGVSVTTIMGVAISLVIAILIFVAANKVRQANKEG